VKIIHDTDKLPPELQAGAISIGNFDGVHRGHAVIAQRVCKVAKEIDGPSIIVTFSPHPLHILSPKKAPLPLVWTERKAELLATQGIACLCVLQVTKKFLDLTPQEFFDRIVLQRLAAAAIVEGPNFHFGKSRSGTIDVLQNLSRRAQVRSEIVEPITINTSGTFVSSSKIRQLLLEGQVEQANRLLTRPHRLRGKVSQGAGRGAELGFPTANLEQIEVLVPAGGVYAGIVRIAGKRSLAAVHIGPNPTFEETDHKVEIHLLDHSSDLYDQWLEVDILARVRETRSFATVAELQSQLARDVAKCREYANSQFTDVEK